MAESAPAAVANAGKSFLRGAWSVATSKTLWITAGVGFIACAAMVPGALPAAWNAIQTGGGALIAKAKGLAGFELASGGAPPATPPVPVTDPVTPLIEDPLNLGG